MVLLQLLPTLGGNKNSCSRAHPMKFRAIPRIVFTAADGTLMQ